MSILNFRIARNAHIVALTLVACLAGGSHAHAQGVAGGLYLGVGAGVVANDRDYGESDASPSIRLGYEFNQRLGAELGYLGFQDSDSEADIDTDAWSASLVLSFPLTSIDLYGKLGAMNLDSGQGVRLGASSTADRSTRGFAALGAQMRIGLFDLYGEFTRVNTEYEDDLDVFSAGLKFSF